MKWYLKGWAARMIDLNNLNPPQREAVLQTQGPLLVLAGAGSGKTRVLTYRIAHLIESGVPAYRILAITFTNKAAREMQKRVLDLCGEEGSEAWVSTFHSCCSRILRRDIEKLGYKRSFSIYDDGDQSNLIKRMLKEADLDEKIYPPRLVKSVISDAKNAMQTPDEWLCAQRDPSNGTNRKLRDLYEHYQKALKENNALDFDDLLIKTLELFIEHPPVLDSYRDRFDYVLVDEYQDTNRAQYEFVRLMAGEKRNLCVVGDDDQSIYGWRGADLRNILDFEKDYPDARVIKLEQNYRSTGNILNAANQIIARNCGRKEKVLWTQEEDGEKIGWYEAVDEQDEANWLVRQLEFLGRQGVQPGDCAVLYRANAQSRILEEALVRSGIPYRVYGGQKFYDRKEVKDVVAYLRVLANPDDDVSLARIINEPRRAIGESTVEKLRAFATETGRSLYVATMDCEEAGLNSRALMSVMGFRDLMAELFAARFEKSAEDFVEAVLEKTGYRQQYMKEKTDENQQRLENIQELVGAVKQYEKQNPEGGIEGFLENVALVTDLDSMPEQSSIVTLMTMHMSKGLEFGTVFVTGMEENVFPIARAIYEEEQLEEERRLCYVAVTRARERLFLSSAGTRMLYGNRQMNPHSRFLDEIPARLVERLGRLRPHAGNVGQLPDRDPEQRGRFSQPSRRPADLGIPGVSRGFPTTRIQPGAQLFSDGDRVSHRFFGVGVVTGVTGQGNEARVTVRFERGMSKTFPAATAPIVKT